MIHVLVGVSDQQQTLCYRGNPGTFSGTRQQLVWKGNHVHSLAGCQRSSCCGRRHRVLGSRFLFSFYFGANRFGPITPDSLILYVLLSHNSRTNVLAHYTHKGPFLHHLDAMISGKCPVNCVSLRVLFCYWQILSRSKGPICISQMK